MTATRKRAPKKVVTFVAPVNPKMQMLSKLELLAHSRLGEKQAIEAGLEMVRRADKAERRKAEAQAA